MNLSFDDTDTLIAIPIKNTHSVLRTDIFFDIDDIVILRIDKDNRPYYISTYGTYYLNYSQLTYFVRIAYESQLITKKKYHSFFDHKALSDPDTPAEEVAQILREFFKTATSSSRQSS